MSDQQTTETPTQTQTDAETVETTALGAAEAAAEDPNKQREGESAADFAERLKKQKEAEDAGKKPDDQASAGAPEKYELKAPEGSEFDSEAFEAIEPTLRELGLTNVAAQKLVDAYAGQIMPKLSERANKLILDKAASQRAEWAEAFEKDPDIGGARKGDTLSAAARVFDHYGLKKGEGLRQLLDESGLGNHPELIRVFARIGHDMAEGGFERGEVVPTPKTAEQTLYGPEFQGKAK